MVKLRVNGTRKETAVELEKWVGTSEVLGKRVEVTEAEEKWSLGVEAEF